MGYFRLNQETNLPASAPGAKPQARVHPLVRALVSAIVVLVLSTVGILYGQQVIDRVKASQFQPNQRISQIVERVGMTDRSRDVFYATAPVIEDRQTFNQSCQSEERTAAILGCYFRDTIYLYDIDNKKLDGTLEVTAAHELLHAAYQRLNFFERRRVDLLISAEYDKLKDDTKLKEIMQYYHKTEPGAEINELHSILGTTVATLDPELEAYYARYFKQRASVVALNAAYNKVFGDIKTQADTLEARVKQAEPTITKDLAAYDADLKQLELDIENFNQQANTGYFSTRSSFNVARNTLLGRVDALNQRRDEINARVAAYNKDVEALNALSVQASELYKSINGAESTTGV